ncbi:MAG TPA: pilus assembly protein N-terminal domain-containing protein [Stellaceae bacterium]|nr:pilus assembly protein N-terminal domain-containing protein [Stellaceae bacterium]
MSGKAKTWRMATFAAVAFLLAFADSCAWAQTGPAASEAPLRVTLNHATAVTYEGSGAAALIADPAVADIVTERGHVLFVLGRAIGTTNLLVYDAAGRRLMEREVVVVPDEAGVVTVTRDIYENDYFCTPRCVSPPPPAAGSAPSAPGGGGPAPFGAPQIGGVAVPPPAAPATAGIP